MAPADLLSVVRARPFQPFRIVLLDGMTYEVRHPELVIVAVAAAFVGYPSATTEGAAQRVDVIGLPAVARLEFIEQPQPSIQGNGNAS